VFRKFVIGVLLFLLPCPVFGRSLHLFFRPTLVQFDPLKSFDLQNTWLNTQIYEPLFEIDKNNEISPVIVKSWKVAANGLRYDFELNDKNFSDGSPLSADDVKFTLQRAIQRSKEAALTFGTIRGVDDYLKEKSSTVSGLVVRGDRSLIIEMNKPEPMLLKNLALPAYYILPSRYVAAIGDGSFFKHPVGSGPYVFSAYNKGGGDFGEVLVFDKNEYYLPSGYFDSLIFYVMRRPLKINELGRFDLIFSAASNEERPLKGFEAKWFSQPSVELIIFNQGHTQWKSIKERQRFAACFDREAFYKVLFEGRDKYWSRLGRVIPSGMALTPTNFIDNKECEKLDMPVKIHFATHEYLPDRKLLRAVKMALGMDDVDAEKISLVNLPDGIKNGKVEIFMITFVADLPEPFELLKYFSDISPVQFTGKENSEFTMDLIKARNENDVVKRADMYSALDEILLRDYIVIPIAMSYYERVLVKEGLYLGDFGSRGLWYYPLSRIRSLYESKTSSVIER